MIGFVNSIKRQVNQFEVDPQPLIASPTCAMQTEAQLWIDLIWTSSEALESK